MKRSLKQLLKLKAKVICVDCDGTLTLGTAWTVKEAVEAKPNRDIISQVNEIARKNFIVIYTARRDFLIPATLDWLRRNGVTFHAISNNKIGAEVYIDDRAISP